MTDTPPEDQLPPDPDAEGLIPIVEVPETEELITEEEEDGDS